MLHQILKAVRGGGGSGFVPTVGAYGKLSRIGDFVSVRANAEPVLAFQAWLAHTLEWAERRQLPGWPTVFDRRPPIAFMFRPRRTDAVVVGVLRASRDAVGRRHPFAVFSTVPVEVSRAAGHLLPVSMLSFVQSVDRIFPALDQAGSSAEVEALLASVRPVEIDETIAHQYDRWIHEAPAGEAWTVLYGAREPVGARYALQMIREVVTPFARAEEVQSDLAVRLPVSLVAPAFEASFWVDLVMRMGGVRRPSPTLLFYPAPMPGRALYLALGEPHPCAIAEACVGSGDTDIVCDLTAPAPTQGARLAPLGGRLEHELVNGTLVQLLQAAVANGSP